MSKWPKDTEAALMAFYGTPGPAVEAQLIDVIPPFRMIYEGKPIARIKFHKKAAAALLAALTEIWEHYGKDQNKIDALRLSHYDGAYNPRKIAGSNRWSNHAFGAAIDLDAAHNGFNTGHGTMPQAVVDAFKRQGARWGGDYHGRTDPMHFEFCDNGQPDAVTTKPVAPAFPESGKGSWYSQFVGQYTWKDDADEPNSAALGCPDDAQGVSFYNPTTLGHWFEVRAPNGTISIEQQTDIGPHPNTGRKIDISAAAAERFGYSPATFPTNGVFSWRSTSPPVAVVGLAPKEQAIKFRDVRNKTVSDVLWIQQKINKSGANPPLMEDGNAGPLTFAAIRKFIESHSAV